MHDYLSIEFTNLVLRFVRDAHFLSYSSKTDGKI